MQRAAAGEQAYKEKGRGKGMEMGAVPSCRLNDSPTTPTHACTQLKMPSDIVVNATIELKESVVQWL